MIDWEQVNILRADLGEGFDELVEVFLDEMDGAVARLDPSAPPERIAGDLHFLKGSALNLGFAAFAGLCAAGELQAGGGAWVDLAPIRTSYRDSRLVFLAGLQGDRAA